MKYILEVPLRLLWALCLVLTAAIGISIIQSIYFIWYLKFYKLEHNFFEYDTNDEYSHWLFDKDKDPNKIWKSPFHWALKIR